MTQQQRADLNWDELLHSGTGPIQEAVLELVRSTQHSRHYCDTVVWGHLQTPEYARAVLKRVVDFYDIPDDVEAGVAARRRLRGRRPRAHPDGAGRAHVGARSSCGVRRGRGGGAPSAVHQRYIARCTRVCGSGPRKQAPSAAGRYRGPSGRPQ
ncbi:Scr1 family TA system antitoxin-like transcriptional regulator [Streptomyces chengmaiensis]|uniref:Scr1 family TA system antitoxin-like transcriptional regulator n=1 Tax=Streptomyces chengmaiensis TaxID=3040919 RepID=UPI0037DA0133